MKHTPMNRHFVSETCGDMNPTAFETLKKSICENGFRDPNIFTLDGQIADGWHRYKVAIDLDRIHELTFTEIGTDVVETVIDKNLNRRSATKSARAVIVCELYDWASLGTNQHEGVNPVYKQLTAKELAEKADCSRQSIQEAKKVIELGLADKVKNEGLSLKKTLALYAENTETDEKQEWVAPWFREGYTVPKNHLRLHWVEPETFHLYWQRPIKEDRFDEVFHITRCESEHDYSQHYFIVENSDGIEQPYTCPKCTGPESPGFFGFVTWLLSIEHTFTEYKDSVKKGETTVDFDIFEKLAKASQVASETLEQINESEAVKSLVKADSVKAVSP